LGGKIDELQRPLLFNYLTKLFLIYTDVSQELLNDMKAKGKKQIYILKPDAGCQGRGIRLIQVRNIINGLWSFDLVKSI
jgi:hypothetical protein